MQQAIRTVDIGQAYLIAYVKPLTETLSSLISAQISELREHLDQVPVSPDPDDEVVNEVPGPELLFGRNAHATREELLAALPPRSEADRLIDTFFISMESHPSMFTTSIEECPLMSAALIHKPTFLKQVRPYGHLHLW